MQLMYNKDLYDEKQVALEVDKLSYPFLQPRGFSFFQFKRIYKDGSFVILANRPEYFQDYLEKDLIDPRHTISIYIRQSSIFFWDESLSSPRLSLIKDESGIHHGLTIISRRKNFFDCTTFGMPEHHPCPFAYYFHILKELQKFSELFPSRARILIEKSSENSLKFYNPGQPFYRKGFFLPKRSARFQIGEDPLDYITTYEALCVQLLQDGKSYKEIGSILSMAPSTVETHLKRLKARTGLTLQELTLQFFQKSNGKRIVNLESSKNFHPITPLDPKKRKQSTRALK